MFAEKTKRLINFLTEYKALCEKYTACFYAADVGVCGDPEPVLLIDFKERPGVAETFNSGMDEIREYFNEVSADEWKAEGGLPKMLTGKKAENGQTN